MRKKKKKKEEEEGRIIHLLHKYQGSYIIKKLPGYTCLVIYIKKDIFKSVNNEKIFKSF